MNALERGRSAENDAHGPDWSGSLPGEPDSCLCGYNGTSAECAASRVIPPAVPARDRAAEVEAAEDRADQAAFDAMREAR